MKTIAQDEQWWDQIIWVIGAWQHYLVTGDRDFLAEAYRIGVDSARILHRDRFRAEFGLYAGPAVMQDGISGYPSPPAATEEVTSFVLDQPGTHQIMCLSTNAVHVEALRSLGRMAALLGVDGSGYEHRAAGVAAALDRHLWSEDTGLYGYFVHGSGELAGTVDDHREAAGLALVVAFGIADSRRADRVLAAAHRQPRGVTNVWPHFADRFSDDRPGRHNVMLWPMVMGLFGLAGARARHPEVVSEVLRDIAGLVGGSDGRFDETYDSVTGAVDGGWQNGHRWDSVRDQTWSATSLLRLVHEGVLGLVHEPAGIRVAPTAATFLGDVTMTGLPYRQAVLDVTLTGADGPATRVLLDGRDVTADDVQVEGGIEGRHRLVVRRGAAAAQTGPPPQRS